MDLKKYLPTEEMMADFEEFSKLTTAEEMEVFHAARLERYKQKTPQELDLAEEKMFEGLRNMKDCLDELTDIVRLGEVSRVISLSYVAEKYFGKTRQWLYQRLNGNMVNGKPARFTPDERQKLSEALADISRLIRETSLKIA
ncbi:MAG: DUF5053 domain-containing protein [Bacteroidales bacterium]|jgi:hypothetical protein|nr:DUF5053 domain-containing protein [Bacteroidales bacterium]